jgi:hypothetical protein
MLFMRYSLKSLTSASLVHFVYGPPKMNDFKKKERLKGMRASYIC